MVSSRDPALPEGKSIALIPALIAAFVCVGLIRSGFLTLFFLVPLGVIACGYNQKTFWIALAAAVLGNGLLSLGLILSVQSAGKIFLWDIFYFSLTALIYGWIMAPSGGVRFLRFSRSFRFITGSVVEMLFFFFILAAESEQGVLRNLLWSQAEAVSSLYISSSGADVVRRSLLEQYLTPQTILDALRFAALRGGGVVSCLFVFFINRQLSFLAARLIRRGRAGTSEGGIVFFHTPPWLIWVLSFSLLLILGARLIAAEIPEIIAWNILVISGVLYLAQGSGIIFYFLSRSSLPPFFRVLLNVLIVFLILSPGLNMLALGALALLGIAENWVPFRVPKSQGPSSTPGM
jgi:uncharacterized protein YybS (DUF2232 family)